MLTAKQEAFAQGIIQGLSYADAYRAAYDTKKMSTNAIYVESSKLVDNPKIAQRVAELRKALLNRSLLRVEKRLDWLADLMESDKESTADRLRASDQMNKIQGVYVQKLEGDVTVSRKMEDLL